MPPVRPLRDRDKYYPGSPFGDTPPQETVGVYCGNVADPRIRNAPVVSVTSIQGLQGPIVEREAPAGPVFHVPRDALRHVDAYFEYRQLVGDSDGGRLLDEAQYEALREKAADPNRRVWVHWVEANTGLECKAIGPNSRCFCGHGYREHSWADYPETLELRCKMAGCPCSTFNYMPVRGSGDLKCSSCRRSFEDHDARTRKCKGARASFASSYSCSCNSTYDMHRTVVQTNAEREAAGKSTNAPWLGAAAASGLPTAHMGGIGGFTALADGVDRALAGLEPGFEPQRISEVDPPAHWARAAPAAAIRQNSRGPLPIAGRLTAQSGGSAGSEGHRGRYSSNGGSGRPSPSLPQPPFGRRS